MSLQFKALSQNESFARVTVAAFLTQLDPTMDELTEIKTVVSEAVTNSIIHGYNDDPSGVVYIEMKMEDGMIDLEIRDEGQGIMDVEEARQPLFTSKPDMERSGMGFTIMENFMDQMEVISHPGTGTIVRLRKHLTKSTAMCN